jgi:hypothetical protein
VKTSSRRYLSPFTIHLSPASLTIHLSPASFTLHQMFWVVFTRQFLPGGRFVRVVGGSGCGMRAAGSQA